MEFKLALAGLLQKTYNKTQKEIDEILKSEDDLTQEKLDSLINENNIHVNKIKSDSIDDGIKQGKRKGLKELEGTLKEKYKVTSTKTGADLIEEIYTSLQGSNKTPITEDDIKKHPSYLEIERKFLESETNRENAISDYKKQVDEEKEFDEKSNSLISQLKAAGLVLPKDAEKAQKQASLIKKELKNKGYKFQTEGNNTIILDSEGKRLDKENGHPFKLEEVGRKVADDLGFEFSVSAPKDSPSGKQPSGEEEPRNGKYSGPKPTDKNNYVEMISDRTKSASERMEIEEMYGKEFGE